MSEIRVHFSDREAAVACGSHLSADGINSEVVFDDDWWALKVAEQPFWKEDGLDRVQERVFAWKAGYKSGVMAAANRLLER